MIVVEVSVFVKWDERAEVNELDLVMAVRVIAREDNRVRRLDVLVNVLCAN
jgi:hypothetical protein